MIPFEGFDTRGVEQAARLDKLTLASRAVKSIQKGYPEISQKSS